MSEQTPHQAFDPNQAAMLLDPNNQEAKSMREFIGAPGSEHPVDNPSDLHAAAVDYANMVSGRPNNELEDKIREKHEYNADYNATMGRTSQEKSLKELVNDWAEADADVDETRSRDAQAVVLDRILEKKKLTVNTNLPADKLPVLDKKNNEAAGLKPTRDAQTNLIIDKHNIDRIHDAAQAFNTLRDAKARAMKNVINKRIDERLAAEATPEPEPTPEPIAPEPEPTPEPTEPETPPTPEQPQPKPTAPEAPEAPERWDDLDQEPAERAPTPIPEAVVPSSADPDSDPGIYKNVNQPEHPTPVERREALTETIGDRTWKWLRGHDEKGSTTRIGGVGRAIGDAIRRFKEDKDKTPKQAEQAAETVAAMTSTVMGETVEPVREGSDEAVDFRSLSKDDLRGINLKSLSSEDFAAAKSAMDLKGVLPTLAQQKEMNRRAKIEQWEAKRQASLERKEAKRQAREQKRTGGGAANAAEETAALEPIEIENGGEVTPVTVNSGEVNYYDNLSPDELNTVDLVGLSPVEQGQYLDALERAEKRGEKLTGFALSELLALKMSRANDVDAIDAYFQKAVDDGSLNQRDLEWLQGQRAKNARNLRNRLTPLFSEGQPAQPAPEATTERTLADDLLGERTTPVTPDTLPENNTPFLPLPSDRMKMNPKEYGDFVESLSDDRLAKLFDNVQSFQEFNDLQDLTNGRPFRSALDNSELGRAYRKARDYFVARDYFEAEGE